MRRRHRDLADRNQYLLTIEAILVEKSLVFGKEDKRFLLLNNVEDAETPGGVYLPL